MMAVKTISQVLLCAVFLTLFTGGTSVKDGRCPRTSSLRPAECPSSCTDDESCDRDMKCCGQFCPQCKPPVFGKLGVCPEIPANEFRACSVNCADDDSCEGDMKCCGGCCRDPIFSRPGKCPPISTHIGACYVDCSYDIYCDGDMKCCGGCPMVCKSPVTPSDNRTCKGYDWSEHSMDEYFPNRDNNICRCLPAHDNAAACTAFEKPDASTCHVYGRRYAIGAEINCACTCIQDITGTPRVSCRDPATCPLPTCSYAGEVHNQNDVFISRDGCNMCTCISGFAACTDRICAVPFPDTSMAATRNRGLAEILIRLTAVLIILMAVLC